VTGPAGLRIGVFGGSFDPPHVGHVLAAGLALAVAPIDRLLVVPALAHALDKQEHAAFRHRVAMCELAFADLRHLDVSDVEAALGAPSRTLHTLEALAAAHPGASFRLVLGSDLLAEVGRWLAFDRVAALAPPFVIARTGHPSERADTPVALPEVSSTEVRERLSQGRSADGLVPRAVLAYVAEHGLYRAEPA
jgi:nicotinate-nucleotide adenylyltransferase